MPYLTKLFIILIIAGLLFGIGLVSLAQEDAVLDEEVKAEDLEIKEPKVLPGNPFYFLKNWSRGVRSFFTFNPVAKAKLKQKFANEKLMELKKLAELKKKPELIQKATENYQKEIEKVKMVADKIKEKAQENPKVATFLDKYIQHQTLHQRVLGKLENQVPTEAFEKIKQARETHLERFKDVMLKLEAIDKLPERLEKNLDKIKGSEFKTFRNLEILSELKEKVPEEAREAIMKAERISLEKFKGKLEAMPAETQKRFNSYLRKISGAKEKQLEVLENLKTELKKRPEIRERIIEGGEKIIEEARVRAVERNCPLWTPPAPGFCKEGRIIIKKDPKTGCLGHPICVIPGEIEISSRPKIPETCDLECEKYRYSTCPDGCLKRCIPSTCSEGRCTNDCEGPGSCFCPSESEKPGICVTLWNPVCGKNGKTYSNKCFAELAGVEIDYKGQCRKKECKTDADCPQPKCGPGTRCLGLKAKCLDGKCQLISSEGESVKTEALKVQPEKVKAKPKQ